MALVPCSDLSAAAWIASSDQPWEQLVRSGPSGFPAYARLRFIPDPIHLGQSANDASPDVGRPSEAQLLRIALDLLAGCTSTPEDCYFLLWDGWYSDLYGSDGAAHPGRASASSRSVLDAPKVVVPNRAYYLFRGPLSDGGASGSAEQRPGQPRWNVPCPAFVWPADHAWCVTKDVDPHWAGVGADPTAISDLIADVRLDVVHSDPSEQIPYYL